MRALGLALLLAGCGDRDLVSDDEGVSVNQIERLSTPGAEVAVDRQASARLQPLGPGDLDRAGLRQPPCDFSRGGRMLLAVAPGDAVAKIGGRLFHLTHSGPVGPSGGFFEDRQVSISVGRTDAAAGPRRDIGAWPGRITVTNRRNEVQTEMRGVWRCGA